MFVSLDGAFEGPNRELDWLVTDSEFDNFVSDMLCSTDTEAEAMNRLPKIVFSATLDQVDRSNSRLVRANAAAEVATLQQQLGGGKRPFDGIKQHATFKLAKTYTVTSGVVQLTYVPA